MDRLDDLGVVDPAQVSGCDREVSMPELPLDHDQRDPLARHLDGMRMPQLVRREPAPNTGGPGGVMELAADSGWRARPPARRTTQNAEQRTDRQ
jgi:hypothetical protein